MTPRNDCHWSAAASWTIRTNPPPPRSLLFLVVATAALSSTLVLGLSLPRPTTTTMATTSPRGHRGTRADPQPAALAETGDDGAAFYVHVPYCRRRCHYCDFAIVPVDVGGDDGGQRRGGVDTDTSARGRGFEEMDRTYREAVLTEIDLAARAGPGPSLRSVYFGGGTPSLAPTDTLLLLLNAIRENFDVAPNAEITIEMDPGTFDLHKLRTLASAGFNRVSLGVQSFDDDVLRRIGRVHSRRDVFESIGMLRSVGITNFSIDLISGLPGVSLAEWAETLRAAGDLNPPHVSVYDLQVEPDTLFGRLYPDGRPDDVEDGEKNNVDFTPPSGTASLSSSTQSVASMVDPAASPVPLPSASDCAFMYRYTSGYLRARGYDHYEISSYANANNGRDGAPSNTGDGNNRSRHNSIYWEPGADWFAAGLGATSCIGGKRFSRPRRMADYVQWVEEVVEASRESDGKVLRNDDPPAWVPPWIPRPVSNSTDHDDEEVDDEGERQSRLADAVMTRLRTSDGLDLSWVRMEFGSDAVGRVLSGARLALDLDLASLSSQSRDGREDRGRGDDGGEEEDAHAAVGGGVLRLNDPDGFLFSNTIISSIFAELGVA